MFHGVADTWGSKGSCPQNFAGQWSFVIKQWENAISSYQNRRLAPTIFDQVSAPGFTDHCDGTAAVIQMKNISFWRIFPKLLQETNIENGMFTSC